MNPYFSYDGPEELNIEAGVGRALYRYLYLNHPESDTFVNKMGNKMGYENTFYYMVYSYPIMKRIEK
ncbi:hypothetical protein NSQ95_13990 [Psychrobacillus sp. FSL W7-1457]|uniref:hypothetical protein n=1 Tax=Psychrobacillus sp. FSL W7-1457 TaxID=2954547 RepID=UPI003159DAED